MKLEDIIKQKYGSVDNMLEKTDQISRAYIYKLLSGNRNNPTKNIIQELSRLLEISVEEVMRLTDESDESKDSEEV